MYLALPVYILLYMIIIPISWLNCRQDVPVYLPPHSTAVFLRVSSVCPYLSSGKSASAQVLPLPGRNTSVDVSVPLPPAIRIPKAINRLSLVLLRG